MAFRYGWRRPPIVSDGLALYLDAGSPNSYRQDFGTIWRDVSGNGRNGTLTFGPTFDSANGGSIVLDGVDDFVDCGDVADFTPTSSGFSVEIWYYQSININGSGGYGFADKYGAGASNAEWLFGGLSNNRIYAWIYDFTNGAFIGRYVTSADSYSITNAWNQCVWTYDGGTTDGSNKIYINGIRRDDSNTAFGGTFVSCTNGNLPVKIGGANSGLGNGMNGKAGVFMIYKNELTSAQITQNYNALKSRFGL